MRLPFYPKGLRARFSIGGYYLSLLLLLLLPWVAQAQAPSVNISPSGPLTLCSGSSQTLTASVSNNDFDGIVRAVLVQPDGKIVVGGGFTSYNGNAAAPDYVLRLNADGSLDTSFNYNGTGLNSLVYALALQSDGKILVGGIFTSYNGNAAAPDGVLRLNDDGSLDTSFNSGGTGTNRTVFALSLQADGKVLVGGSVTSYNGNTAAPDNIFRLNTDGSLDTNFNSGGTGPSNLTYALAVQPNGKILVGGLFTDYNGNAAAPDNILRLNADGSLDPSFNVNGTGADGDVRALTLQPDGKVVVGGVFSRYNGSGLIKSSILRLNSNGSLDTGFNSSGVGLNASVRALAIQPDGKVMVGGDFTSYNSSAEAPDYVLRLNTDGSLDTQFNRGGMGADRFVYALVLQPDNKILVGGLLTKYNQEEATYNLLRLRSDGSLDSKKPTGLSYRWSTGATEASITVTQPGLYQVTATTPDGTGYSNVVAVNAPPVVTVQVTPTGPLTLSAGNSARLTATATTPGFNGGGSGFNGNVHAVVVQPDGKVLVGGSFTAYNGDDAAPDQLLRLNADGTLDTSFNAGGSGANSTVTQLVMLPNGQILVGGYFTSYNVDAAAPDRLLRLNADGTLDKSFNPGGSGFDYWVDALVVQSNGKIVVGGRFTTYNGAVAQDYVLRLNANGTLDSSFNPGGTGANNFVQALAIQPDGKLVIGGFFSAYNGVAAAPDRLLRLNGDGTLDTSFNPGEASVNNPVYSLVVQPDGKVLAGGLFTSYNGVAAAPDYLLRLNTNGTLDTNFNPGGSGPDGAVQTLYRLPDGKLLVGGEFRNYSGAAAPDRVLRLNPNGTLDTGFNSAGAGANSNVFALAIQPDGKILAGGNFTSYNGTAAAPDYLLRLNTDGTLNTTTTSLPGATFIFNPGNTTGNTRIVGESGSYQATATDPATGCTYTSNEVVVTATAPTLISFSPNTGAAGSTFTLTASSVIENRAITFTSSAGMATSVTSGYMLTSATTLEGVVVPVTLAPGVYSVTLTTINGTSNALPFTVTDPIMVTDLVPSRNLLATPRSATVAVTFSRELDPATANNLALFSAQAGGRKAGTYVVNGSVIRFDSPTDFKPGETLTAIIPASVRAASDGAAATPLVYQFTAAVGGTGRGRFVAGSEVALGDGPSGVVVADVDSDGDLDLVAVSYDASALIIRLNDGTGAFSATTPQPLARAPIGLAVGDVDGDGNLDVLTANYSNNSVTILLNDGTGMFSAAQEVPVGGAPRSVSVGDVDADGDLDLLTANSNVNSVSIRLNNGMGIFSGGSNVGVGRGPERLTVGDVDADGDLDLLTANLSDHMVSVRFNSGTGLFSGTTEVPVGTSPTNVLLADVDSDGDLDILASNSTANTVSVRLNDSYGSFVGAQEVSVGNSPYGLALGDVDADGDLDLLTASSSDRTVSIRFNDGKASFFGTYEVATESDSYGVTAADVDGDGDLDLLTTNSGPRTVSVRLNESSPLPVTLTAFSAQLTGSGVVRLAWTTAAELNSDSFIVERSLDGLSFTAVGRIAAAGTSTTVRTYALKDDLLPAGARVLYYRLQQLDRDSTIHYSQVQVVRISKLEGQLTLYPNPTLHTATLTGATPGNLVQVFDAVGRLVLTTRADSAGKAVLTLPQGQPRGMYVVRTAGQTVHLVRQ
jgi:uncharacterized delta-60 repeat protein